MGNSSVTQGWNIALRAAPQLFSLQTRLSAELQRQFFDPPNLAGVSKSE